VSAQAAISLDKVTKFYETFKGDRIEALTDVSLDIGESEFVTLVGPSGCGKSTLLKIISGLLPHTDGTVMINGQHVTGPTRDIGFVFQRAVLLPWKTVLGNVLLPFETEGKITAEHKENAMELLAMTGLKGFEHRYPTELSGGMQQRVSIARALVYDPALLLMDEPFGALDALTRDQMNVSLLDIWAKRKKTIVFVTHSISEAVFLADKVVVMTRRPAKIADVIKVDLERPRRLEMIESDAFGKYSRQVRKLLDEGEGDAH